MSKKLRLAFGTQTNTVLPVIAYFLETATEDCKDVILVNSRHLSHPESRSASEKAIVELVNTVAPHIHCKVIDTDLPLHLTAGVNKIKKILAVFAFKKLIKSEIAKLKQKFKIEPLENARWVTDVGIRNLTSFAYSVSPGGMVFVPHEMRHFNDYASRLHQCYWGAPGLPGARYRRALRMLRWLKFYLVGCEQVALYWPKLIKFPHVSYNEPLLWHPKSSTLKNIHSRRWYENHMVVDLSEYKIQNTDRVLILLSQVFDRPEHPIEAIKHAIRNGDLRVDQEFHVKMHPQEIGRWDAFCLDLEDKAGVSVCHDRRINYYPSELWLAAVPYNLVVGYSSGGMFVAREVYSMNTLVLD